MQFLLPEHQAVLSLVRRSLEFQEQACPDADWQKVEDIARVQGVLWMLYTGAKAFNDLIPLERTKAWRSDMLSSVLNNEQINTVQSCVLEWTKANAIRCAILKGTSCARYYPCPEARSLGDIDILIDQENLEQMDSWLKEQGYVPSDSEHDFHVGYYGKDAIVEVHYAGTTVPDSKGGSAANEIMTHFLDHVQQITVNDMVVSVLSDSHQALMLLLHMERHMTVSGIGLRQLCDWAVFVNGSSQAHWHSGTLDMLQRCGLLTYAKVLTKTCVDFLGLEQDKAEWCRDISQKLTRAMMDEIFRGGNMGAADENGMGNPFSERSQLGQSGQNKLTGVIGRLTTMTYRNFPYVRKCKLLLPIFWMYFSVRYLLRYVRHPRSGMTISHAIGISNRRQNLYNELHLYEVE